MFFFVVMLLGGVSVTWIVSHQSNFKANKEVASTISIKENSNSNHFNNLLTSVKNNNDIQVSALLSNHSIIKLNKKEIIKSSITRQADIDDNTFAISNKHLKNKNNQIADVATSDEIYNSSNQNMSSIADNVDSKNIFTNSILSNSYRNSIQTLPLNLQLNLELKKNKVPTIKLPECPTIEKAPVRTRDYLEIYASPDYGIRTMSDDANPKYLKSRDSSSKFSSAYSLGIRYTKVFKNGISLRAGINYSQINEWFTPAKNNILSITYTIDPTTHDTTGTSVKYKITHNHYSTLDIPITVGYEFNIGKLVANINAGPIINIYSWQNGDVLRTDDSTIHITTSSATPSQYQFKTNIGVGLAGGISLYYQLNDRIYLLAEPYFRCNFQQINSDAITLSEKYSTIGLHLGMRIDLNKIHKN